MYWLCMIATIPLATGNKLNCFISASGMLAIVWHCVLFCCFFCVCFLLIFYMLINHLLKKKTKKKRSGDIRIVFDCDSKFPGYSLNDCAFRGPNLNNKLSNVLVSMECEWQCCAS